LYEQAFERAGLRCHVPSAVERELLMKGIYDGVKSGDIAYARECFTAVARALAERHDCRVLVMGCTEIPLALAATPQAESLALVDPAQVMARALALRAYGVESGAIAWEA
jgi:aspartate racemase